MDTSSSEYDTPSVESGLISVLEEEEEFSRVKMHNKNQDLVAEVMEKEKDTVRPRFSAARLVVRFKNVVAIEILSGVYSIMMQLSF